MTLIRFTAMLSTLATAALLTACGGGDGDSAAAPAAADNGATPPAAGGAATVLACNTAGYQAGTVELPSAAQLSAYAATYNGQEGSYDNAGSFKKSADAVLVLAADGRITYQGVAYTPESVCIDKTAGIYGRILYVLTAKGHFDISDKVDATLGSAWGVSAADGMTIFTKGLRP